MTLRGFCKFTETNCDPGVFDEVLQLVAEGSCTGGDGVGFKGVGPVGELLGAQSEFKFFTTYGGIEPTRNPSIANYDG